MRYLNFRNPNFSAAVRKIGNFEGFSQQGRYRAIRLMEWLEKEEKTAQKMWEELIAKYAEKDESGKIKSPDGAPQGSFRIPEQNRAEFEKKGMEWADLEIEYNKALPISRADIEKCGLSPVQELALEGFIEPLSEESL